MIAQLLRPLNITIGLQSILFATIVSREILTFATALNILAISAWQHRHRKTFVLSVEGPGNIREHVETKLKLKHRIIRGKISVDK